MWLFLISTVRWKMQPFFRFSPWWELGLRHFSGYPFGTSRKKHQPFSMVQPPKLLSYEDSPRNRIKKLCLQYVVETLSRQKQLHPITEPNISTIQYINHPIYQSYWMAGCIVSPVSESNHIEGAACSFLTEYIPPNHASPWSARQERVASCTVKHILIRKIL